MKKKCCKNCKSYDPEIIDGKEEFMCHQVYIELIFDTSFSTPNVEKFYCSFFEEK